MCDYLGCVKVKGRRGGEEVKEQRREEGVKERRSEDIVKEQRREEGVQERKE